MPTRVMTMPLNKPARPPTRSVATTASSTLPVPRHTKTNPTIPRAMIDGNDKSMSPVMITIVSGSATNAKNGVVWANDR
jgi:hypothetical protein